MIDATDLQKLNKLRSIVKSYDDGRIPAEYLLTEIDKTITVLSGRSPYVDTVKRGVCASCKRTDCIKEVETSNNALSTANIKPAS